jgi:hypothetical protein
LRVDPDQTDVLIAIFSHDRFDIANDARFALGFDRGSS